MRATLVALKNGSESSKLTDAVQDNVMLLLFLVGTHCIAFVDVEEIDCWNQKCQASR